MTQFKEKADQLCHAGILTYPVLMAADILIHKVMKYLWRLNSAFRTN